jgi:A/G-specific adenine glycosylase
MRDAAEALPEKTASLTPRPSFSLARKRLRRSTLLLAWYDRHARVLPWRALPGETSDPYRVWLSEIMLQQTTVKTVIPYFRNFITRWNAVQALAMAPLEEVLSAWAGLGYYARARNLHACAKAVVERHSCSFPQNEAELAQLPGIGRYTAAAIAAIAFGERTVPVDGNVKRVVARVFGVDELPAGKGHIRLLAESLAPAHRHGDFAQALMDLGATICTPRRPRCGVCPWREGCEAHARGDPENFPHKSRRRKGRARSGAAFVAVRADGAVLVRTRAFEGLLGGMSEVPSSPWSSAFRGGNPVAHAPCWTGQRPRWRRLPRLVRHVFTHFPLELAVYTARVSAHLPAPHGLRWVGPADLAREPFPALMRKVLDNAGVLPARAPAL